MLHLLENVSDACDAIEIPYTNVTLLLRWLYLLLYVKQFDEWVICLQAVW